MADKKNLLQDYYNNHVRPPFAKIYTPTAAQFADPYKYVESIKDEGRNYGVIKIIPPECFKPPFSLARSLQFKPRSQRLSMTDAFNKEHYLLLDKLKVFYESEEEKSRAPKFGNQLLNLAVFFVAVDHLLENDADTFSSWIAIAKLCRIDAKFALALRFYYRTIISPFRATLKLEQHLRRRSREGQTAFGPKEQFEDNVNILETPKLWQSHEHRGQQVNPQTLPVKTEVSIDSDGQQPSTSAAGDLLSQAVDTIVSESYAKISLESSATTNGYMEIDAMITPTTIKQDDILSANGFQTLNGKLPANEPTTEAEGEKPPVVNHRPKKTLIIGEDFFQDPAFLEFAKSSSDWSTKEELDGTPTGPVTEGREVAPPETDGNITPELRDEGVELGSDCESSSQIFHDEMGLEPELDEDATMSSYSESIGAPTEVDLEIVHADTKENIRRSNRKPVPKLTPDFETSFEDITNQPAASSQRKAKRAHAGDETGKKSRHHNLLPQEIQKRTKKAKTADVNGSVERTGANAEEIPEDIAAEHFEAPERYSLQQFQDEANLFKSEFFNVSDPTMIGLEEVERMFWKNVGDLNSDLFAFYGADLNSGNFGSGFPMTGKNGTQRPMTKLEEFYSKHPWNLNNMPIANESAFYHLPENISGMTIPWVYVGMCFSLFCWHVEDHWTYSINYMHEGETKVWYGIPESDAQKFDDLMRQTTPELFEEYLDVLHHMSTMAHPQFLQDNGVTCYTVHQNKGEIVITFPRAYHAGFNAGYNVAEAVNFAPYDWLRFGRLCLQNYSEVGRNCVFSHDHLILSMAKSYDKLDVSLVQPICEELTAMIRRDLGYRKFLLSNGFDFNNTMQLNMDFANEDFRSCVHCNTLLFCSAVVCRHMKAACPVHYHDLCAVCPPSSYFFAYSTDILSLYHKMVQFAENTMPWRRWASATTALLDRVMEDENAFGLSSPLVHQEAPEPLDVEEATALLSLGLHAKLPLTKESRILGTLIQRNIFIGDILARLENADAAVVAKLRRMQTTPTADDVLNCSSHRQL